MIPMTQLHLALRLSCRPARIRRLTIYGYRNAVDFGDYGGTAGDIKSKQRRDLSRLLCCRDATVTSSLKHGPFRHRSRHR